MSQEPEASIMRIILYILETGAHYIGYMFIALFGGAAHYLSKIRSGEESKFHIGNLLIDLLGSGFAGLMVALLATHAQLSIEIVYFLTGMAGHMGVRMIFMLRSELVNFLKMRLKDKS